MTHGSMFLQSVKGAGEVRNARCRFRFADGQLNSYSTRCQKLDTFGRTRTGDPTGNVRTLQKVAKEAKVPEFSLHDLRATGNSFLANARVDQRIRQYLMGHKAGGPVISRYTKITADTEQELRDAVAVF
jgi:integrase